MHHFAYRDGVMHAEDVDLRAIASAVGTPFYCYSTATIERHYRVFNVAFADVPATEVHFADTFDRIGPLGAKSMSESPYNPIAAALANAVRDATSIRLHETPFTADRLHRAVLDRACVSTENLKNRRGRPGPGCSGTSCFPAKAGASQVRAGGQRQSRENDRPRGPAHAARR